MTRGSRPPTLATSIVSSSLTRLDKAHPNRHLICSAAGIGVCNPTAISCVKRSPPIATTPVCHKLPRSKMAKSVVPPPMSTRATPSSFSSFVKTASLAAICPSTVSNTATPARLTHPTLFCVDDALPVMMWTFTSSLAPVMPMGAPIPSCSSTTKSCGRTCRISRPFGSATALAASTARPTSSLEISRFFPATATTPRLLKPLICAPDSPKCTESISTPATCSASSMAFLTDSTAASRFTTTPRRIPCASATPIPIMSSPPSSIISPTMAVIFDVPTSRPTRYRSLRATHPPFNHLPTSWDSQC